MMVNCKNGISSYEVARDIGITQKSAWFMLHRIRTSLKDDAASQIKIDGDGGPIEVDEQVFRYNNRATKDNPLNDADRFMLAVSQIVGKRLTYAELTGKVGETAF